MPPEKKAAKKTHNDIEDLPPDEPAQEIDEESPSDVLGIDIPAAKGKAKNDGDATAEPDSDARPEPDERPGDEVLAAVADEAAKDEAPEDEEQEPADEPDEGDAAEAAPADADEPEPLRTVKFERDGEVVEVTVPESEAQVLEGILSAADVTRDKYAHLQDKYLEAVKGAPAPAAKPTETQPSTPTQTPQEQADARLNQMMGTIPQVVEAYTPVVSRIRDALPEENDIREFIEDQPVIAAILAAMWDGQADLAAQGAVTQAERAQTAFRNHVDGLINHVIRQDGDSSPLSDPDVRDDFDAYLVSLGPIGEDGQHDPTPIRATLMRDDGRWLSARWSDFQLKAALAGAKPEGAGVEPTPNTPSPNSEVSRRRAIDPSGGSRSGSRQNPRKTTFSREVSDVLGAK